jgi:predicted P-loop ATPase
MEQTQGCWIVEVTELAGAKKAEVEFIKAYVSRTVDRCRKAYGRFVDVSPRQFVLVGTTNESSDYLRDHTGNRRFYPIHCAGIMGADGKLDIYYAFNHFTKDIICQVWAEVLQSLKEKEFDAELPADLREVAEAKQESMTEKDERANLVQKYVDMLVPTDWDTYDDYMKTKYTQQYIGADFSQDVLDTQRTEGSGSDQKDRNLGVGTEPMKYVKIADIWQYVFLEKIVRLDSMQARMIAKMLKQCGYESKMVRDPSTKKHTRVWVKKKEAN